jgi:hypothetical protein
MQHWSVLVSCKSQVGSVATLPLLKTFAKHPKYEMKTIDKVRVSFAHPKGIQNVYQGFGTLARSGFRP